MRPKGYHHVALMRGSQVWRAGAGTGRAAPAVSCQLATRSDWTGLIRVHIRIDSQPVGVTAGPGPVTRHVPLWNGRKLVRGGVRLPSAVSHYSAGPPSDAYLARRVVNLGHR